MAGQPVSEPVESTVRAPHAQRKDPRACSENCEHWRADAKAHQVRCKCVGRQYTYTVTRRGLCKELLQWRRSDRADLRSVHTKPCAQTARGASIMPRPTMGGARVKSDAQNAVRDIPANVSLGSLEALCHLAVVSAGPPLPLMGPWLGLAVEVVQWGCKLSQWWNGLGGLIRNRGDSVPGNHEPTYPECGRAMCHCKMKPGGLRLGSLPRV